MPTPTRRRVTTALLSLAMAAATSGAALAQKKYDTGASEQARKLVESDEVLTGERWQLFGDVISGELSN
jgi:hypothetical protein